MSKDCQVVQCGQTDGHDEDNTAVTLAILDCQVVQCGQTDGHDEDNTAVTLAILYKRLEIVRQGAGIPETKTLSSMESIGSSDKLAPV